MNKTNCIAFEKRSPGMQITYIYTDGMKYAINIFGKMVPDNIANRTLTFYSKNFQLD